MAEEKDYMDSEELCGFIGKPVNLAYKNLSFMGYVEQKGNRWRLTKKGQEAGGFCASKSEEILWKNLIKDYPEIKSLHEGKVGKSKSTPQIANMFACIPNAVENILHNMDLIIKNNECEGWRLTEKGRKNGGEERSKVTASNQTFYWTLWPYYVYENKLFKEKIEYYAFKEHKKVYDKEEVDILIRGNVPENVTDDGHYVRSKAELIIDNFLFKNRIFHIYEKSLSGNDNSYCDFYLPDYDLYIEYWGFKDGDEKKEDLSDKKRKEIAKYLIRKAEKLEIYHKNGIRLLELEDQHLKSVNDSLPRLLLTYGVKIK
jgi:hypothetical protein